MSNPYPIQTLNHSYLGSGIYELLREALITGRGADPQDPA